MKYILVLLVLFAALFSQVSCGKEKSTDLSIVDFGADPSGTRDSTSAIQTALNQAKSTGVNVYVPAGTYKHDDVIIVSSTHIYGDGDVSIVYATDQENRAIQMEGSACGVRKMKVTGVSQPRNNKGWNNSIFVSSATNFIISNVTIMPTTNYYAYSDGSHPAVYGIGGIISWYSQNGLIQYTTVAWTWADGIHTTGKSNNITIRYNTVHHVGDDSIPVVSYVPDEVTNVEIYGNNIYSNVWARGIPVIGGSRIRVYENTLTNILSAAFWVAAESSYNTLAPHDVIYARNTVINATNVYGNCEQNYAGLPASGVGNGNSGQGSIYNVLFVDNTFQGSCTQQIRTEGDPVGEVVYANNKFTNGRSTIVELKSSSARFYSVANTYDGGNVNGFYAISNRAGLYSLNDSFANIVGGSVRAYWLRDGATSFQNIQIQNVGLAPSNKASFWPFLGTNDAVSSLFVSNVYNAGNQVPANHGTQPPTASSFTLTLARPSNKIFTVLASTLFSHASTSYRLLAAYGGVGGKADISFEHDRVTFTITDNTKSKYSFYYVVGSNYYGAAVALCTINIAAPATPTPTSPPVGTGLRGEYFTGTNFGKSVATRTDATVNFNWGSSAPTGVAGMPTDLFSVRWTGFVKPTTTGTYTFSVNSDDGTRLWVNGQSIINDWTDHAITTDSGSISLTAGLKYPIVLEYYENGGDAAIILKWSASGVSNDVIPTASLYPN